MSTKKLLIGAALMCATFAIGAQPLNGTWIFEKSNDFIGQHNPPPPPPTSTLQITNNNFSLPSGCLVILREEKYYPGGPFQSLLKGGAEELDIGTYLNKQFTFKLANLETYYTVDPGYKCNNLGDEFLMRENQLIVINASTMFYSFKRAKVVTDTSTASALGQLKPSQLPFNLAAYISACLIHWPLRKGVPQNYSKCGPVYSTYVASAKSTDPISVLVASHAYTKNGAQSTDDDYDNPGAHGLHPVFTILPPLKDVVVARVDDLEGHNEEREVMDGAYLAIKDGKVTDQLNDGCSFDALYICSGSNPERKYKLNASGKFEKIP